LEGDGNRSEEDVVRNRLGVAAVAALVVLLASLSLVAHASGSSSMADGAGAATAQLTTQPALSPIQQLAFKGGEGPRRSEKAASTASVGPPGELDGHIASGYCHLQF
jgi:hypothetical protein